MKDLVTELFLTAEKLTWKKKYACLRIGQAAVFIMESPDYLGDKLKFLGLADYYANHIHATHRDFFYSANEHTFKAMHKAFNTGINS